MPTSISTCEPTENEFIEYIKKFPGKGEFLHKNERAHAILAGWDDQKFDYLYKKYILSTQSKIDGKTFKANDKGNALEELARYFLKHGGIVKDIIDIKSEGRWQVDGQGIINKSNMEYFWGEAFMKKIGFQLYLECKNHSEPAEKAEFSDHCIRMGDNNCTIGIMASTSGFKISRGKGIAEKVYTTTQGDKYYLLMSIRDFHMTHSEKVPPISVLTEALERTTNDKYRSDRNIQKYYTKKYCHELARKQYELLVKSP